MHCHIDIPKTASLSVKRFIEYKFDEKQLKLLKNGTVWNVEFSNYPQTVKIVQQTGGNQGNNFSRGLIFAIRRLILDVIFYKYQKLHFHILTFKKYLSIVNCSLNWSRHDFVLQRNISIRLFYSFEFFVFVCQNNNKQLRLWRGIINEKLSYRMRVGWVGCGGGGGGRGGGGDLMKGGSRN